VIYRNERDIIPKDRIEALARFKDETAPVVLTLFVGTQERIPDLLNNASPFLSVLMGTRYTLINKDALAWIRPADEDRLAQPLPEAV